MGLLHGAEVRSCYLDSEFNLLKRVIVFKSHSKAVMEDDSGQIQSKVKKNI